MIDQTLRVPQPGDRVLVRGGFGAEKPLWVSVEDVLKDNGDIIFTYTEANGQSRWAYLSQIERIQEDR